MLLASSVFAPDLLAFLKLLSPGSLTLLEVPVDDSRFSPFTNQRKPSLGNSSYDLECRV